MDVESIVDLHRPSTKISTPLPTDDKQPSEAESAEPKDDTTVAEKTSKPEGEEGKRDTEESAELEEGGGEKSAPVASEDQLQEDKGEKESVELTGEPVVVTEAEGLEMEKSEDKGEKIGEEGATGPPKVTPVQEESVVIVSNEDSGTELTKIFLEAFRRYDKKIQFSFLMSMNVL